MGEMERQLLEVEIDRTRLGAIVDELQQAHGQLEAERDAAAAARVAAESRLQHAVAEARATATEQQVRDRLALDTLTAQHADAVANAERTAGLVSELRRLAADHEAARTRLEVALTAARAEAKARQDDDRRRLEDAEARPAQARAEQQRLLRLVERETTERQQLEAAHAATREGLERRLAQEYERTMAARDRERTELLANLQADLAVAVADQRRLQSLVARAETEHHRLIAAHAADRADADRALGEALLKKHQIAKTFADQRIELDQWRETARELETLATAGRLAVHVSRELHELIATLDDRARFLLSVSALDAGCRHEVERLRADAMHAASLARQLVAVERDVNAASGSHDAPRSLAPAGRRGESEAL
jgi:hypothetical protein